MIDDAANNSFLPMCEQFNADRKKAAKKKEMATRTERTRVATVAPLQERDNSSPYIPAEILYEFPPQEQDCGFKGDHFTKVIVTRSSKLTLSASDEGMGLLMTAKGATRSDPTSEQPSVFVKMLACFLGPMMSSVGIDTTCPHKRDFVLSMFHYLDSRSPVYYDCKIKFDEIETKFVVVGRPSRLGYTFHIEDDDDKASRITRGLFSGLWNSTLGKFEAFKEATTSWELSLRGATVGSSDLDASTWIKMSGKELLRLDSKSLHYDRHRMDDKDALLALLAKNCTSEHVEGQDHLIKCVKKGGFLLARMLVIVLFQVVKYGVRLYAICRGLGWLVPRVWSALSPIWSEIWSEIFKLALFGAIVLILGFCYLYQRYAPCFNQLLRLFHKLHRLWLQLMACLRG